MNPSPIRNLVARHVCTCRPLSQKIPTTTTFRFLSTTSLRNATSSPVATYGSAELLSRRYQRPHLSVAEEKAERAKTSKKMRYSAYGIAACTLAIFATIYAYPDPRLEQNVKQAKALEQAKEDGKVISLDAPPTIPSINTTDLTAPQHLEHVPTGTSTIPTFPRTIHLSTSTGPSAPPDTSITTTNPTSPTTEIEYQLVGLGIRTVSIFGIQVYVVGLYIAVPDIAALQEKLIRTIDPVATTLVANEKTQLRDLLLDPVRGEEIWNRILSEGHIRTAFRIVPTRNTDVMHMRDGFVRGITAKSQHFVRDLQDERFGDESFGVALGELKTVFGGSARKKIPTGETLLLLRDERGVLKVVLEDKSDTRLVMGEVRDERVGRLLWLNYLAGQNVSSEAARRSVVDGCVEFVERPVGTVAAQVV